MENDERERKKEESLHQRTTALGQRQIHSKKEDSDGDDNYQFRALSGRLYPLFIHDKGTVLLLAGTLKLTI